MSRIVGYIISEYIQLCLTFYLQQMILMKNVVAPKKQRCFMFKRNWIWNVTSFSYFIYKPMQLSIHCLGFICLAQLC